MDYDKPFHTYEQLLEKLEKDHQLKINNKKSSLEFLKTISYYDLKNGYQEFFMSENIFNKEIDFEFLSRFYFFDKSFQTILFKYSVFVENIFKTRLAYFLSQKMGVDTKEYLDIKNYIDPTYSRIRKNKLKKLLIKLENVAQNIDDNPTKYYRERHNHIPAWILLRNTKFNDTVDLFSYLKSDDKIEIVNTYFNTELLTAEEKIRLFKNMITIVRKFRNKIAHNLKPITFRSTEKLLHRDFVKISENGLIVKNDIKRNIGINDLYSMILSEIVLLNQDYIKLFLMQELTFILSSAKDLSEKYIEVANLPSNILERFQKVSKNISDKN